MAAVPRRAARSSRSMVEMAQKGARKFFVGGNWKMNGDHKLITKMFSETLSNIGAEQVDVVLAPPFPYLYLAKQAASNSSVHIAAQNVHQKTAGAFTGEVSVSCLQDLGISWVILGHSERRTLFAEHDQVIREKVSTALTAEMNVILCIGESAAERDQEITTQVIHKQLNEVLPALRGFSTKVDELPKRLVVAYEPVWAIGTGKVATPSQAQQVHAEIRKWIGDNLGSNAKDGTRVIYGGSVTASNCQELAALPDVDGFLVGGASLKPEFREIIASAQHCE